MTKVVTVKWYPYIHTHFNKTGVEITYNVQTYSVAEGFNTDYNFGTIALPPMELKLEVPNHEQVERALLALMHQARDKLKAEHIAAMTKLQLLENTLLRLDSPEGVEVLDPVQRSGRDDMQQFGTPGEDHYSDEDKPIEPGPGDDIPF